MRCIVKDCTSRSGVVGGRTICVEPDEDGWICESCWKFLTTGIGRTSGAYRLAEGYRLAETINEDSGLLDEEDDIDDFLHALAVMDGPDNEPDNDWPEEENEAILVQQEWEDLADLADVQPLRPDQDVANFHQHMQQSVSNISYPELLSLTGMNEVRGRRLSFDNLTLKEKAILKRNGILVYTSDMYERDNCRCEDFACDRRWVKAVRRIGWEQSADYNRYLGLLEQYEHEMNR